MAVRARSRRSWRRSRRTRRYAAMDAVEHRTVRSRRLDPRQHHCQQRSVAIVSCRRRCWRLPRGDLRAGTRTNPKQRAGGWKRAAMGNPAVRRKLSNEPPLNVSESLARRLNLKPRRHRPRCRRRRRPAPAPEAAAAAVGGAVRRRLRPRDHRSEQGPRTDNRDCRCERQRLDDRPMSTLVNPGRSAVLPPVAYTDRDHQRYGERPAVPPFQRAGC